MPKKKSKKNKASKNKTVLEYTVKVQPEEIEIKQEEISPEKGKENVENLVEKPNTKPENTKEENHEETAVKEVNKEEKETDNTLKNNTEKEKKSLKKRFSFSRNKKNKIVLNENDEPAMNGHGEVRRSNSLSSHDGSTKGSRIPLGKFRTLQFNKKKQISSSCGNFDASKTQVSNAGTDDWRMTGLLDTVAKSNSMVALDTSGSTNLNESVNKDESAVVVDPTSSNVSPQPVESKKSNNVTVEDGHQQSPRKNTSPDIIVEEDEQEALKLAEPIVVEIKPNNQPKSPAKDVKLKDLAITVEDINAVKEKLGSPTANSPKKESQPENVNKPITTASDDNIEKEVVAGPTSKDSYELSEDQIITIRKLCDVIEEFHIELPQDIQTSDWLVLNLSQPTVKPLITC